MVLNEFLIAVLSYLPVGITIFTGPYHLGCERNEFRITLRPCSVNPVTYGLDGIGKN
jgi:hypothetical protein